MKNSIIFWGKMTLKSVLLADGIHARRTFLSG